MTNLDAPLHALLKPARASSNGFTRKLWITRMSPAKALTAEKRRLIKNKMKSVLKIQT
jgi:hypothetical protein